jgi:hypothetical protein
MVPWSAILALDEKHLWTPLGSQNCHRTMRVGNFTSWRRSSATACTNSWMFFFLIPKKNGFMAGLWWKIRLFNGW